jgi:hypothetical protein
MSPELGLLFAPRRTYAVLAGAAVPISPLGALRRPLLAATVLGVSLAISATGRVTPALVLSATLTWGYIVMLQLAVALPLVTPAARRTVGVPRALDLFFAGHAPWSLFALAAAAWAPTPLGRSIWPLLITLAIPIALTPRILVAFFAEVLRMDRRAARRMTVLHQAITWIIFAVLFWVVNALSPRVLELLGRT